MKTAEEVQLAAMELRAERGGAVPVTEVLGILVERCNGVSLKDFTAGVIAAFQPRAESDRKVSAIDLTDFIERDIPKRKPLLSPFLLEKSLGQCFAARGVGKTHVSLGIGYAVATGGSFLQWEAPEPARVLLVDGEMAADDLQGRLRAIQKASEEQPEPGYFQLISYDLQGEGGLPSLATPEGQAAIDEHLDGVQLVILDNLSCLFSLPENDADEWKLKAQPWLMGLRRQGISALFMHHANKSGDQRGTGAREDVLDYVIQLKHPSDYEPGEPARFEVSFTKCRQFSREGLAPFEAKLTTNAEGAGVWECKSTSSVKREQAIQLLRDGWTQAQVVRELGILKGTLSKWRRAAVEAGELDP